MNKNLIDRHNEEVANLNLKLKDTREELHTKKQKLDKYVGIV